MLEKKRTTSGKSKNPGEVVWEVVGFYSNLEQALQGLLRRHIQTTEVEGISYIIHELKAVQQAFMTEIKVVMDNVESSPTESNNTTGDN
jgi:hypothetical protein